MNLHQFGDTIALITMLPLLTAIVVGVRYISKIESVAKQSLNELRRIGVVLEDHEDRIRDTSDKTNVMWHVGDYERRRPVHKEAR